MFFRIFVGGEKNGYSDIVLGIVILIVAVGTAFYKAKLTNATAWIPTLFFMIAVTIVETVGVLKIGVNSATAWIVAPLVACNAYQILILQRVLNSGSTEIPKSPA